MANSITTTRLIADLYELKVELPEALTERLKVYEQLAEAAREAGGSRHQGALADPADLASRDVLEAAQSGKPLPDPVAIARRIEAERHEANLRSKAFRAAVEKAGSLLDAGFRGSREQLLATIEEHLRDVLSKAEAAIKAYPGPLEAEDLLRAPEAQRKAFLRLSELWTRYAALRRAVKALRSAAFGSKSATADGDGLHAEWVNGGSLRYQIARGQIPAPPQDGPERLRWMLAHGAEVHAPTAKRQDELREAWNERLSAEGKALSHNTAQSVLEQMAGAR